MSTNDNEPEYDRTLVERYYAGFANDQYLLAWQNVWQRRIDKRESLHWTDRPKLCGLHLEIVSSEISQRNQVEKK